MKIFLLWLVFVAIAILASQALIFAFAIQAPLSYVISIGFGLVAGWLAVVVGSDDY